MALDDGLDKVASGISVSDAVEAYLAGLDADAGEAAPAGDAGRAPREARAESEAIVEIMFLVAAVDGHVAEEELAQLGTSTRELVAAGVVAEVDPDALVPELRARFAAEGWHSRLHAAARALRAPEAKRLAFRLGAGVAFVDDNVAAAEAAALDSLAKALDLDSEEAHALLVEVQQTLFG